MNTDGKDFLSDGKFVTWMLTGDVELQRYWDKFLEENPALRSDFDKAADSFKKLKLSGGTMSLEESRLLRLRIARSVARPERKRIGLGAIGYAAACVLALIGFSIYMLVNNNGAVSETDFAGKHIIVGESLSKEEISLITESSIASFSGDVHLQVDSDGKTVVEEVAGGKRTVVEGASAMNKLVVPYGKRSRLILPDGTRAWINSGSVIEFPASFDDNGPRRIGVAGEIYIEVAPDAGRPFYVDVKDFSIKVYGTKFNVSAYSDSDVKSVVLVDGKVSVSNGLGGEMFLLPNEMLSFRSERWSKEAVNVADYVSWKDGYLILNGAPVSLVLKRMERFYNLSFNISDSLKLEALSCTGKLYLSENADEVLSAVSFLSGATFRRQGGTVYIEY
jgi:ferric-dicitrate binding protein FerR (iron transport regulator)